jgi:hypothetical protein
MKSFLRCPLVCGAALAAYVAVHVFAGVLHHHGPDDLPARSPADMPRLQLMALAPTETQHEESCLLCSVLHLPQVPTIAIPVEIITALHGEARSATANLRRHPLETATYSRGPPLI